MNADYGIYTALLVTGFLGSLGHCLGMCGPLVMMVSLRRQTRGLAAAPHYVLYHAARIAVYACLGAIAGMLAALLGKGTGFGGFAAALSIALGVGVCLLGAGYAGWLPIGRLEGPNAWLNRAMDAAFRRSGVGADLLLGALNGLLPCGLVYSALLVAASTGGAPSAALGMVLFGLGTFPALFVLGIGAGMISARIRRTLNRLAGFLIILVGLQLILRGAAALSLIPHLHAGKVMLW